MTTPTGQISLNNVAIELGVVNTNISMNQANVRTLAGVGGSGVSYGMASLRGKSNVFYFSSGGGANFNLRDAAIGAGWNQSARVEVTLNSGAFWQASSVGNYAVYIQGSFPNGITLINNGYILGCGGSGGLGGWDNGYAGSNGGPALVATTPVLIYNYGFIAGGGGGGGGGAQGYYSDVKTTYGYGGGGGGGGSGNYYGASGGGGGYGTAGSGTAGGGGGMNSAGAGGASYAGAGGSGGNGGAWGANGNGGASRNTEAVLYGGAGGGAGQAASGNGGNITWGASGATYGAVAY